MNVTTFLLTSALATGGEPCPDAGGCESPGILVRLRAKFSSGSCVPCGRPLFAGFTTTCHEPADPCGRPGLLTRLKAKFQSVEVCAANPASCAGAATGCSVGPTVALGRAIPIAPPVTSAPVEAPKVMAKPDAPK